MVRMLLTFDFVTVIILFVMSASAVCHLHNKLRYTRMYI